MRVATTDDAVAKILIERDGWKEVKADKAKTKK